MSSMTRGLKPMGRALAIALIVIGARALPAVAATPEELAPWLGCFEVTISKGESHIYLGIVRLTDNLQPATSGSYDVQIVKEGEREIKMSSWWPMDTNSISLGLGNGYTGWSGNLRKSGADIVGNVTWSSDTGQRSKGSKISAIKRSCDA